MSDLDEKSMLDLLVELDQMECGERPPRGRGSAARSRRAPADLHNLLWVRPYHELRAERRTVDREAAVLTASSAFAG